MIEGYSFVAITSTDLGRDKHFWIDCFGCREIEGDDRHFIVDAGGLRLSVDLADGEVHVPGATDPVIGFRVASMEETVGELSRRGLEPDFGPAPRRSGQIAIYRDPGGRRVILEDF